VDNSATRLRTTANDFSLCKPFYLDVEGKNKILEEGPALCDIGTKYILPGRSHLVSQASMPVLCRAVAMCHSGHPSRQKSLKKSEIT
jgi:hypothetical protein